jgi:hypothetical protein
VPTPPLKFLTFAEPEETYNIPLRRAAPSQRRWSGMVGCKKMRPRYHNQLRRLLHAEGRSTGGLSSDKALVPVRNGPACSLIKAGRGRPTAATLRKSACHQEEIRPVTGFRSMPRAARPPGYFPSPLRLLSRVRRRSEIQNILCQRELMVSELRRPVRPELVHNQRKSRWERCA